MLNSILFIESDRNYITVITKTQKLSYIDSLKNWTVKLPKNQFIQVHKSWAVQLNKIEAIERNRIKISNTYIPIGDSYKNRFREAL